MKEIKRSKRFWDDLLIRVYAFYVKKAVKEIKRERRIHAITSRRNGETDAGKV
jgi:hypothetical protein